MDQSLKLKLFRKPLSKHDEEGFSLIELVVVISVLVVLGGISVPSLTGFINEAILSSTKNSLRINHSKCLTDLITYPENPSIRGVVFESSNCSEEITATINNECSLSMNMSTGKRSNWKDSYKDCVIASANVQPLITDWDTYSEETSNTANLVPNVKESSCEDTWGGTSYTGSASYAVDGDPGTKWTCNGPATIDFELQTPQEIRSINVGFTGSTTNGNYIKIYIDDKLVAEGTQSAAGEDKTWLIQPTVGSNIRYETILQPHAVLIGTGDTIYQTANWSEIGELSINGPVNNCTNKSCWNDSLDKNIE